jgi:hypothetical protein
MLNSTKKAQKAKINKLVFGLRKMRQRNLTQVETTELKDEA